MTDIATAPTYGIGARQVRLEDEAVLTGRSEYTGDVSVPGCRWAQFVRSPLAHARITSIDVSAAEAMDGVVAVLTHDTLPIGPVFYPSFAQMFSSDRWHRRPLASDTVRFVGDIVAVVVAETQAVAEDAAELVLVDYEPLPIVLDAVEATGPGSTLLFPDMGTNVALDIPFEAGSAPEGDDVVSVSGAILNHRMGAAPMEGTAIVAVPDPETGRVTAHVSTQMPHVFRDLTASFLEVDPAELHVLVPAVGGGFGGKPPPDPDYVAVIAAARHLRTPIRWVQSRHENLLTMQARDHRFEFTLDATPDGRVTSLRVSALTNVGAYPGIGCGMIMTTRSLAPGAYTFSHVQFDVRCVATNTPPTGAFRGAGRPEATALLERAMDMLAGELDMDPAELRRRNLIQPDQFPYATLTGGNYDTGEYERCLDEALRTVGYDDLRRDQAQRRRDGGTRHLGIGLSFYVEMSANAPGFGQEHASVEIIDGGRARVVAGTLSHGQSHHTAYAQILASTLGVAVEDVDFIQGDTDAVPQGTGTGGSRSIQVGGSAVKVGADVVLQKARELAAHLLETSVDDIVVHPQVGLGVLGDPSSAVSWADLADAAKDESRLPEGMEPGLFADPGFEQEGGTAPFGCHVAVVEVDEQTGEVDIVRYVAVDDCGVVLNPLLAEGQVHGGLLGGIGQALFEEARFDDAGNPVTSNFTDYGFPTAAELPSFETAHTVTPTPRNPLGVKGLGEAGTTGSIAAIHNAVVDAVSHLGIRHIDLPLSPFRVWSAIRGRERARR